MTERLNDISTLWSVLQAAHGGEENRAQAAREIIVDRYGKAIRRYLLAAVSAEEADDLFQEFALTLIQGKLHSADRSKGRFRDYIKVILFNLVAQHRRRQGRLPQPVSPDAATIIGLAAPEVELAREFDQSWREQMLARVWQEMASSQSLLHAVLRFRADHPDMPAAQIAETLGQQLGKPFKPEAIRQNLRRAREIFAELLLAEISQSLETPSLENLTQELEALDLLNYCKSALERRLPRSIS